MPEKGNNWQLTISPCTSYFLYVNINIFRWSPVNNFTHIWAINPMPNATVATTTLSLLFGFTNEDTIDSLSALWVHFENISRRYFARLSAPGGDVKFEPKRLKKENKTVKLGHRFDSILISCFCAFHLEFIHNWKHNIFNGRLIKYYTMWGQSHWHWAEYDFVLAQGEQTQHKIYHPCRK